MIKLKICGMKSRQNMEEVATLGPDYLGFIFYPDSPRNFTGEIPPLGLGIKKTGVFVNASFEEIEEKIRQYSLDAVQLHGEEDPGICQAVRTGQVQVIKVFSIRDQFDFQSLEAYEGAVDFFLFDTLGKTKGGTGKTFHWDLLYDYPSPTPFFLSGGIGEEEAKDILSFHENLKALGKEKLFYAIDVNSRFEQEPGLKLKEKLERFQTEIRKIAK